MTDSNLFGATPWLNRYFLEKELLMNRYVTDDWLPGGIQVAIIRTLWWRYQYECCNGDYASLPTCCSKSQFHETCDGRVQPLEDVLLGYS